MGWKWNSEKCHQMKKKIEQNRTDILFFRTYTKYIVTIQYIYICHDWYMLHSDNSYACLRDNNSVCIFFFKENNKTNSCIYPTSWVFKRTMPNNVYHWTMFDYNECRNWRSSVPSPVSRLPNSTFQLTFSQQCTLILAHVEYKNTTFHNDFHSSKSQLFVLERETEV